MGAGGGSPPSSSSGFGASEAFVGEIWNSDRMIRGEREHGDTQRSENDELFHS